MKCPVETDLCQFEATVMISEPTRYMWCQCEGAVREIDDTPCPSCRRCPICGQKIQVGEHCGCVETLGYQGLDYFTQNEAIPESELPREFRRVEIRKELQPRKTRVDFLCGVVHAGMVAIYSETMGRKSLLHILIFASVSMLIFVLMMGYVRRKFRALEERQLDVEFPP